MNDLDSTDAVTSPQDRQRPRRWLDLLGHPAAICALLAALALAVFWPVLHCDFINYGDPETVIANPHVRQGFTLHSLVWAFGATDAAGWHPLSWLSHAVDVQLFGLNPAGPHWVNLLLHLANTLLLFVVLRRFTGAQWRSAAVAALFALHPLQVESVAWISERKMVLGALFLLLTLLAYGRYQEQSKVKSQKSNAAYRLTLLLFALGLMTDPILVTAPFLLLLLDYWPLERVSGFAFRVSRSQQGGPPDQTNQPSPTTRNRKLETRTALLEKIPFFVLSGIFVVITLCARNRAEDLEAALPLGRRVANALVAYAAYLGKAFWPDNLALLYPRPGPWPAWEMALAALLVLSLCAGALWLGRKFPHILTGWFWFWGMLLPAVGLVSGTPVLADRYVYLPLIGLFIMIVWSVGGGAGWRAARIALPGFAMVLAALAIHTRMQLGFWRDSGALFRHTIFVTRDNGRACDYLGLFLSRHGRPEQALESLRQALRIDSDDYLAHRSMGSCHYREGRLKEAAVEYERALRLNPEDWNSLNNLGSIFLRQGQYTEAIQHFRSALRLKPDYLEAHNNLGVAFQETGRTAEAIREFGAVLQLAPNDVDANCNLGNVLAGKGRVRDAIYHYRQALKMDPQFVEALNNLGWILAMDRQYDAAIAEYQRALKLKPQDEGLHCNFADVLARAGHPEDALEQYREALRLSPEDVYVHLKIARILSLAGRRDEAVAHARRALQLDPGNAAARKELENLGVGLEK